MSNSYLLTNGPIWTGDAAQPWAQAAVVRGADLVHVGTSDGAAPFVDAGTELIDLQGRMCLPGFIDAHNHLASMGVTKLGVNLSGIVGRDAVLAAVRDWVASQPATAPLRGHAWMPDSFEERSPRREWLDEITGDRPMYVLSADAHDCWFNTAAMAAAGVGPDCPDPDPGAQYYVRDPDGMPTGHAVEGASLPITLALGMMSVETVRAAQELTLQPAPSWGMTAYFEAGVIVGTTCEDSRWVYEDLIAQDESGTLPVRISGSYWTRSPSDDPLVVVDGLVRWNRELRSDHVAINTCKLWADGTLMSGGALLLSPFSHGCGMEGLGSMTFPPEHIEAQIEATQAAGFDMHIHVDADGSTRAVLDAYEAVLSRRGSEGRRHVLCHNSGVDPADMNRYTQLGIIANCTPLWGTDYNGQNIDIFTRLIGPQRMEERLFPYGDLVRSGAVVTYGSDIPGVDIPEIPPLIQIEALLTRQRPGYRDDIPLVPRQRIGLHDALRGYTANGAYQLRLEHRTGALKAGMAADLTVLGADLFRVDPHEIHDVPVVLTMMDGRITHDAR